MVGITCDLGAYSNCYLEGFGYLAFEQLITGDWPKNNVALACDERAMRSSLFPLLGSQTEILHKLVDY
jgi:hypothetical protein